MTVAPAIELGSEQAVIGATLHASWGWQQQREYIDPSLALLEPRDFTRYAHQVIWSAIRRVVEAGNPPTQVFVADALAQAGDDHLAEGPTYLGELDAAGWTELHYVTNHARLIREQALYRRLAAAAASNDANGINEASQALQALGAVDNSDEYPTMREVASSYFDMMGDDSTRAVRVGIGGLDRTTGGFQPGNLITIAARPAVGKSAIGITIAYNVACRQQIPVGLVSLEMSNPEIMQRLIAMDANVSTQEARTPFEKVATSLGRIEGMPLYIRRPGSRLTDVLAASGPLVTQYGCQLIIIDYLQLMTSGQSDSRPQDLATITRELKNWAQAQEVPLVVLAQLKRDPNHKGPPRLEDFAEGDAPARDSDIVLFLHPEDDSALTAVQPVDLIIGKHRNGPLGSVAMQFVKKTTRFVETEWSS